MLRRIFGNIRRFAIRDRMNLLCLQAKRNFSNQNNIVISFDYQKRVRYGETDQMGYLYYGNYAQYYEIGRVELMRSLGVSYKQLEEEQGILMPVMSLNMRFVRPARYDELLTIRTTLRELPAQSITFHVEIFNEQKKLLNGGSVKLCFVDAKTNKTLHTPDALIQKLQAYFQP
jgi:acyl-CoA thioester hydrolase